MAAQVSADFSQLRQLERLLDEARRKASTIPNTILAPAARRVFTESVANAQGMADTGELASSVRLEQTLTESGPGYRIGADVRQAFFLEYGSPNTGAPRPWLSAPAQRAVTDVLTAASRVMAPW